MILYPRGGPGARRSPEGAAGTSEAIAVPANAAHRETEADEGSAAPNVAAAETRKSARGFATRATGAAAAAAEEAAAGGEEASAVEAAEAATAKAVAERDELKDQLIRAIAEAENTRTIARRDVRNAKDFAAQSFAQALLDVSDSLSYALKAA